MDSIAILDFGSQYSQLIARRVRESHVYCELFPHYAPQTDVLAANPKGFILSGGPASVYEKDAPQIPDYVLKSGLPILGICYGMQALTHALGGRVASAQKQEYGAAEIKTLTQNPLLKAQEQPVWMSHGDRIEVLPKGFQTLASSSNSPIAAMGDTGRSYFGLQFHPEVRHTPGGNEILHAFTTEVCGARPAWTPASIVREATMKVREQVADKQVIAAVSGGVDSSVAATLVHRAVGDQLTCIFVNNGLMRQGEPEQVVQTFESNLGTRLIAVDATEAFLEALSKVTDPEEKRRIIGEKFIRVFEEHASKIADGVEFLVQGTIYPDVVESSAPDRQVAARIKSHHNVGGLPPDLGFDLVEPLRYLFKDEVRAVGLELGLPESLVWRQPFPGPGLAVRCLGEITFDRLNRLKAADRIVLDELDALGLLREGTAQAFAVLLPVRSVGVMGDQRTYGETIVVRAVSTEDYMTADWSRLPYEVLSRISNRIVNEVRGVTRVTYDITSKPPATIEWE
jgi:GMP synthase (glutamine-hydrolysing)